MYSNDKAIDLFNMMVEMNDDYYSSGRPVYVNADIIINDICSKIPLSASDTILDVGCGTGVVTIPLSQKVNYIHALDAGDKVLEKLRVNCKKRKISNIQIHKGFATKLPFSNDCFDKVLMYAALHYLDNEEKIEQCIQELIRVCKPKGYILVAEIPEKSARIEFEKREKDKYEIRIIKEFNKKRKKYDALYKEIIEHHDLDDNNYRSSLIDGDFLINVAEKEGCSAKICKQDVRQPFSFTRRDLIISL